MAEERTVPDLDYELNATPADGDLLHIVDVSDTTDTPDGTSKKITRANLVGGLATQASLDSEVATLESSIATTQGEVDAVETSLATTQSDLDALETDYAAEHNTDGTHKAATVTTLKATGAEVNTGTSDTKIVTPKAMEDSDYVKAAAVPSGKTILADSQSGITYSANQTIYASPVDINFTNGTEANVQMAMPAGELLGIIIRLSSNTQDAGNTVVTARKNAADTNIAVTIAFGTTGNFTDTGSEVFADGDLLDLKWVLGGTSGSLGVRSVALIYKAT